MKYCRITWLVFTFVLLHPVVVNAQKQADNWYFGDHAAVNFGSGSPVSISGSAMYSLEGSASISDSSGNLLFYTNGLTIWDKTHAVMLNGSGLHGHQSSTQSGIIVPFPGHPNKFYVFTVDEQLPGSYPHYGFHYSIVDMLKNGGNGEVVVKNVQLLSSVTEKVTGVSHCNSGDIWIITHGWNNNRFYAYLLTSLGLNNTPVVSDVGLDHGPVFGVAQGYMKASPDGRRLACALTYLNRAQIFDFNASTGKLSNPGTFYYPFSFLPYGLEFSPNGELLYVSSNGVMGIRQHNLTNATSTLLPGSAGGPLQLATDNKIYIGGSSGLSVINNPNVPGVGSSITGSVSFASGTAGTEGLPTFNQSLFEGGLYQKFTYEDTCYQDVTKFNFISPIPVDSVEWIFGDPASSNNTSKSMNPTHVFTNPGNYKVVLKIYNENCPVPYLLRKYPTILEMVDVQLREDTVICDYDSIFLKIKMTGDGTFKWYNNNTTDSGLWVTGPANYFVEASGDCNTDMADINIGVYEQINVEIPNAYLCDGDSILLDASFPNATYLWKNGSRDSTFLVTEPGSYAVNITTPCYSKTLFIEIFDDAGPPIIDLGNDTIICEGDTLQLDATYLISNYLWQDGSSGPQFTVREKGLYFVRADLACHTSYDSIYVDVQELAELEIGNDTSVCYNKSFIINPETANVTDYHWQDGSVNFSYVAVSEGLYVLSASNFCNEIVDSLRITHNWPPVLELPEDSVKCMYSLLYLDVGMPHTNYLWQDNSTNPYYLVKHPGTYTVTASNACGEISKRIEVREKNCECTMYIPNAFTPNDDNLNNYFQVYYECDISNFNMKIFNRWGELIYETNHAEAKWDGRYANGELVQNDTYVYVVTYTGMRYDESFDQTLTGSVTVIR